MPLYSDYIREAKNAMQHKDFLQAESYLHAALGLDNAADDAHVLLAESAMARGEYTLAFERWQDVQRRFPKNHIGFVRAAVAAMLLGDISGAQDLCLKASELAPNQWEPVVQYAECAVRANNWREALSRFEKARKRWPDLYLCYYRSAFVHMRLGEIAKAEEMFAHALRLKPDLIDAEVQLAQCAAERKDFELAIRRCQEICAKYPEQINVYASLARIYKKQGNLKEAENVLNAGLARNESAPYLDRLHLFHVLAEVLEAKPGGAHAALSILIGQQKSQPQYCNTNYFNYRVYSLCCKLLSASVKKPSALAHDEIFMDALRILLSSDAAIQNGDVFTLLNFSSTLGLVNQIFSLIDLASRDLHNPFVYLFAPGPTSGSADAIFQLISHGNLHTAKFLNLRFPNHNLFLEQIRKIIDDKLYTQFSEIALYSFIRLINYLDQDLHDDFINSLTGREKVQPISRLAGLLSTRIANRHALLYHSSPKKITKLKIAVCISGQLRGFRHCLQPFLNAFDFADHDIHFFIHTWENIGRKFPYSGFAQRTFNGQFLNAYNLVVQNKNVDEFLTNKYQHFLNLLNNSGKVIFDDLQKFYGTSDIVIEDDSKAPYITFSNMEKMENKLFRCNQLTQTENFDLVFWMRPDFRITTPCSLSLEKIYERSQANGSVFINGKFMKMFQGDWAYAVNDVIAVGTQAIMEKYARVYADMRRIYWPQNAFQCPPIFRGHICLAYHLYAQGARIEDLAGISGQFTEPEMLPIKAIYDALRADMNERDAIPEDEILLKACVEDLQRPPEVGTPQLDAYITHASALIRKRAYEKALEFLGMARLLDPDNDVVYQLEANALWCMGDLENLEKAIAKGLRLNPANTDLLIYQAEVAMRRKNWRDALEKWQLAHAACKTRQDIYYGAALACSKLGLTADSDMWCEKAIAVNITPPWLLILYANNATNHRNYHEAFKRWKFMRTKHPQHAEGYRRAAWCYWETDRGNKAIEYIDLALALAPKSPEVLTSHAELMLRSGNTEKAKEEFSTLIRIFPHKEDYHAYYLQCLIKAHEFDNAQKHCNKMLKIFPKSLVIWELNLKISNLNLRLSRNQALAEMLDKICSYGTNLLRESKLTIMFMNLLGELAILNESIARAHQLILNRMAQHSPNIEFSQRRPIGILISHYHMFSYFSPIIKELDPKNIDVLYVGSEPDSEFWFEKSGLSSYNLQIGRDYLQNYGVLIGEHSKRLCNKKGQLHIGLAHSPTIDLSENMEEYNFILHQYESNARSRTLKLLPEEGRILHQIHPESKCEAAWTGPFHATDALMDKRKLREQILKKHGLSSSRPVLFVLEDDAVHAGQLCRALNLLARDFHIIVKPHPAWDPEKLCSKLNKDIIILDHHLMGSGNYRYGCDYIIASLRSGTFLSNLMLGQKVIPIYSRLLQRKDIKLPPVPWKRYIAIFPPEHLREQPNSLQIALQTFYEEDKLFDILDVERIRQTILSNEYTTWFETKLGYIQRIVFGDYNITDPARQTAEYIKVFAEEGSLGSLCQAVYLKKRFLTQLQAEQVIEI